LDKLKANPPQDSSDFDSRHWPTADEMDALRCDDDWQNTEDESFPVKKIKQYLARCSPLSAQYVEGWRPREHIAWMFEMSNDLRWLQNFCSQTRWFFFSSETEWSRGSGGPTPPRAHWIGPKFHGCIEGIVCGHFNFLLSLSRMTTFVLSISCSSLVQRVSKIIRLCHFHFVVGHIYDDFFLFVHVQVYWCRLGHEKDIIIVMVKFLVF